MSAINPINMLEVKLRQSELSSNENDLRMVRENLVSYKTKIWDNWDSEEVSYIINAIDKAILEIDNTISKIEALKGEIYQVAYEISSENDIHLN